jgi:hypothetical protein
MDRPPVENIVSAHSITKPEAKKKRLPVCGGRKEISVKESRGKPINGALKQTIPG